LSAEEIPIDACCFHAQQAAEKYLKAYLVSKQISFPKTHDLQALLNICVVVNYIFNQLTEPIIELSDYAIAPRFLMLLMILQLTMLKKPRRMRLK
jgi:HEPN domain-containing protein